MLSDSSQLESPAERLSDEWLVPELPEAEPLWLLSWWTAIVTFGVTTWAVLITLLF